MKFKFLLSFLIAGASMASAQGFTDAVQYYRAGQPADAEVIISRIINEPSTDKAMANYYLGLIAFDKDDFAKAESLFKQGLSSDANNPYNYVGLGKLALKKGDKKAAEENFKLAKKLVKKDALVLTDIARAYYDVDPVANAKEVASYIADAKKANKKCPAIYVFEAEQYADKGDINNAAGMFDMAMAFARDNNLGSEYSGAFVNYARIIGHVNKTVALNDLQNFLQIAPESAIAQRELAEMYYNTDQLTKAAEEYGKYVQNPNHFQGDEQRYVGLLYFSKNYPESDKWADKVLAKDPNNFFMKRMKFLNAVMMGNDQAAFAAADDFFPRNGEFTSNDYTTYAELLMKNKQDSVAAIQYQKAIALNPEKNAGINKDLSALYTNLGKFDEAAAAQEKFLAAGDYVVNDQVTLGRRYQRAALSHAIDDPARAEYVKKGIAVLNEVSEKVPDNPTVLNTLIGIKMAGTGNKVNEEIAADLENLLKLLNADTENKEANKGNYIYAYGMLGNYYLQNNNIPLAKEYFSKVLELDPSNSNVAALLQKI